MSRFFKHFGIFYLFSISVELSDTNGIKHSAILFDESFRSHACFTGEHEPDSCRNTHIAKLKGISKLQYVVPVHYNPFSTPPNTVVVCSGGHESFPISIPSHFEL